MPTVHFLGKVLPENILNVTVGHDPVVAWRSPDIDLEMEFKNHIVDSKIDVECRLNRYGPDDFTFVYMRAFDLAQASVDLVAFSMGYGLSIILDGFIDPSGIETRVANRDETLPALATAVNLTSEFDRVHALVLTDTPLRMAMNDLIRSISFPHGSLVNCARAMDRLRHLIAAPRSNEKQGWQQMRDALQIDLSYLKFITDNSAKPRHGHPGYVPGTITNEVVRRSWIIMNRYIEYRKRSSGPLPAAEFPVLVT